MHSPDYYHCYKNTINVYHKQFFWIKYDVNGCYQKQVLLLKMRTFSFVLSCVSTSGSSIQSCSSGSFSQVRPRITGSVMYATLAMTVELLYSDAPRIVERYYSTFCFCTACVVCPTARSTLRAYVTFGEKLRHNRHTKCGSVRSAGAVGNSGVFCGKAVSNPPIRCAEFRLIVAIILHILDRNFSCLMN